MQCIGLKACWWLQHTVGENISFLHLFFTILKLCELVFLWFFLWKSVTVTECRQRSVVADGSFPPYDALLSSLSCNALHSWWVFGALLSCRECLCTNRCKMHKIKSGIVQIHNAHKVCLKIIVVHITENGKSWCLKQPHSLALCSSQSSLSPSWPMLASSSSSSASPSWVFDEFVFRVKYFSWSVLKPASPHCQNNINLHLW